MDIAVLADDTLKKEFLSKQKPANAEIIWADGIRSLGIIDADIYFDLLFEYDASRIAALKKLLPKPVIINSPVYTLKDTGAQFIRINAWPTMLERNTVEVAGDPGIAGNVFEQLGWEYKMVPDITGMVTPRIISMIINEAWYTFGDNTSTKEEIDIAMKLGTNYPLGPFEWGEKIGLDKVAALLKELNRTDERYTIAPALINEITKHGADS